MRTLERPEIRPTSLLTQSWSIARRNFLQGLGAGMKWS